MARNKFTGGERVIGKESGPASFRERVGTVIERVRGSSEYWVMFEDGRRECDHSHWIELLAPSFAATR